MIVTPSEQRIGSCQRPIRAAQVDMDVRRRRRRGDRANVLLRCQRQSHRRKEQVIHVEVEPAAPSSPAPSRPSLRHRRIRPLRVVMVGDNSHEHRSRHGDQRPSLSPSFSSTPSSPPLKKYKRRMYRTNSRTTIGARAAATAAVVCWTVLLLCQAVRAVPFGTCGTALRGADADENAELSQAEYVSFIRALSRSTVDTEFYEYPTALSSAFTSRKTSSAADAGAPLPSEDSDDQLLFCRDVYSGLASALELTLDNSTCTRSLTLGDNSRDDLLTEDEYARFLSWLTSSAVSSSTAFDDLGEPLPSYFADFADGASGVNVTGSKPGTSSSVDAAQLNTLVDFCAASLVGVSVAADGTDPVASPTSSSATSAPAASPTATTTTAAPVSSAGGDSGTFVPSFSFYECTSAMAFSDLSRDALLDQDEYVRFLNRLSDDEYVDPSTSDDLAFSALPAVLQENYDVLAAGGSGINVEGGTRPGVTPSDEEAVALGAVCNATDQALQEARDDESGGGGGSTPAPAPAPSPSASQPTASSSTSAPVVAATPTMTAAPVGSVSTSAPTMFMSYENCVRYIMLSESTRDGYLDQTEYLRFVNLAANRIWTSLTYDQLAPILQENYDSLATENGTIPVVGYNPNVNATQEEKDHLELVCARSSAAIQSAVSGSGTWPPTSAPVPASTQTIYNGYLISNSVGLKAPGLQEGAATREALGDAYTVFVTSQVNLYATGTARQSSGIRRLLRGQPLLRALQQSGVELDSDTISTYSIVDSICPANSTGTSCQTVYGSFNVSVAAGTDPAPIVEALTSQTQAAVSTDLQGFVDAAVAATPTAQPLTVDGPAPLNRPPVVSRAPTFAPADAPTASPGGAQGTNPGKTAAAIIGFSLLIGLCVAGAIYLHRRGYKIGDAVNWVRDRLSKIPALAKLMESRKGSSKSKKPAKTVGEKADHASRDGSTHLDDDVGMENNGFGTFETASPGDGKPSFFKSEEERDGSSSVDFMEGGDDSENSAGFSVEQSGTPADRASSQQVGKTGVFNAFGLGKKKNTTGLDDSYGSLQNPEAFQENAANDFADYGFDDPIADFEAKSGDSMGELFGKTDEFAAGGAKESAWGGAGEGNEWDGAWGAGNSGEAPRGPGANNDDDDDDDDDSGSDSEESGSLFERKTKGDRGPTVEAPENLVHLDSMVEQGNWDGVMAAQTKFDTGFELDEGSNPSRPSLEESEGLSESRSSADDFEENADPAGDESVNDSHYSLTSAEQTRREQFRQQVESLVRKVVPDEIDNVSAMMDQFAGREAELINTLQNMKERTTVQRARKAIHKSKGIPQRDNPAFATGGTDGSAAIAAASTLGVRAGDYDDDGGGEFDDDEDGDGEDDYYGEEGQSYDEEYDDEPRDDEEEGSQYSGSRSYDEGEEGGSQFSGSQGHSQDEEGSYYDDEQEDNRSGSFSGSGSQGRSQDDGGSYDDEDVDRSASYDDDGGADDQEGSYDEDDPDGQEGSYYSGDEDQEDGSQRSGSGSHSYDDEAEDPDHDASYNDDQGSYDEDDREGEGSYRSGEDDEDADGGGDHHDDPDRSHSHSGSRSYDYDDEGADQEGSFTEGSGSGSGSSKREGGDGFVDYGYE